MPGGEQNFLHRWSRLKREASGRAAPDGNDDLSAASPELPPLDSLNFESDFGAFMRAKVDEGVRRAALKKLFSDPRFNVMDGLDVYIDDYSKEDPIPPGLLSQLAHARSTLFGPQTGEEASEENKPSQDSQTTAGTQPLPASSNESSLDQSEADLVPKAGH
jgi:hypothetical protein